MGFVKNSIACQHLSTEQELLYQLSQEKHHLEYICKSLEDVLYHLKKYSYHASLANKSFNSEVNHA